MVINYGFIMKTKPSLMAFWSINLEKKKNTNTLLRLSSPLAFITESLALNPAWNVTSIQ